MKDPVKLSKEDLKRIHAIQYQLLMHDIHMFQEACVLAGIKYNL